MIKLLGRGGMGAVYQAWDAELGIPVAIKTILQSGGDDPHASQLREHRFKRELLLARQVSHKNVVRIHDMGEVDGAKYITMAFITGETLAARLRRGPLPVSEALGLARQIASGLVAAHEASVIHRDLKPENVMVTPDGVAVIMDFGIARPVEPTSLTSGGAFVGTIEYMAPEQVKGEAVDARTDVYALGLVLYDMLTGRRRARAGESPMSELVSRASAAPPTPSSLGAPVPAAAEAVVMRCLQVSPGERFSSAADVAAALDQLTPEGWSRVPAVSASTGSTLRSAEAPSRAASRRWVVWAGAAALAGATIAVALWFRGDATDPRPAPTPRQSVTVLVADVVNTLGDPTFDGLVEQALGVGLESSAFITAFPRREALRAAAQLPGQTLTAQNARLVALREGVGVVATGRFEPDGTGYRLTVAADAAGIQDRRLFEATMTAPGKADVLPMVGRMAARLRNALGDAAVDPDAVRVDETFTAASLDAARAYVQGQELLAQGRQADAIAAYTKALELDPELGRAWAGLGAVLNNLGRLDESRAAYERALRRVDRMTEREKFRTRAAYYVVTRNPQMALEEATALVQRFPSDAAGLANLANAHFQRRDFDKSVEVGKQAAAIFPTNVLRQNNVALFSLYGGRFSDAEAEARRALALNAQYPKALLGVALAQMASGRLDEAAASYVQLAGMDGGATLAAHGRADLALYRGRLADAVAVLEPAIAAEATPRGKSRLMLVLAEARLSQGQAARALEAIAAARPFADTTARFEGGRLLVAAGRALEARPIVEELSTSLDLEAQALGDVLAAEVALAQNDARGALTRLGRARARADSWWLRWTQGRALLAAKQFAEADSEFDACFRRRGEAVAIFLDDIPTWRVMAPLHYYQGLAREGLGSPGAADSFKAFLANKDGGDETAGHVADAHKRVAAP